MEIIKVSSKSNPNSVAGALANILKKDLEVDVHVVGAGALNQLVKSIIICRSYLIPLGYDLKCVPSFTEVVINDKTKTGIKFSLFTSNK